MEPNVSPWQTVGDRMQLGGTQLTKKAVKVEQMPPSTPSSKNGAPTPIQKPGK